MLRVKNDNALQECKGLWKAETAVYFFSLLIRLEFICKSSLLSEKNKRGDFI